VLIGPGVCIVVAAGATVSIGDGTFVNAESQILAKSRVSIGQGCAIAWQVQIVDYNGHSIEQSGNPDAAPVAIGDHVWIASRASVLAGVTVGEGAIIAAGAVVVRDVPARAMVAGVPARVVRENVAWN
jgi:acetyltransferase-like isoleucine patch superfamily enzyme